MKKITRRKKSYLSEVKLLQPEKNCFVVFAYAIDCFQSAASVYHEN